MNFLRIALFVIFLIAVVVWKNWVPATVGTSFESQPGTQVDAQIDAVVAKPVPGTNDLRIDGHPIISVASIRNAQVVDGDSIRWNRIDGPVVEYRLASIDAPELNQPFGQRAKKYLQSIVAGKELTAYQTDTDQYGRRVAFVFATVPGQSETAEEINAKMVAEGYAWHGIRHSQNSTLTRLEATARAAALGLWEQPNPTSPWEFRDKGKQQRIGSARISP